MEQKDLTLYEVEIGARHANPFLRLGDRSWKPAGVG